MDRRLDTNKKNGKLQISDAELAEKVRLLLWANGYMKSKFP